MSMIDDILAAVEQMREARERRLIVLVHPDRLDLVGDALVEAGQADLVDLKSSPLVENDKAIVINPGGLWS